MSDIADTGDTGGTGDIAGTPDETAAAESWRAALPEALRDEPSLAGIADVAALAKSYVHAQRMIGADKVAVPGKHAGAEEWAAVFARLGRPETPDGYEFPAAGSGGGAGEAAGEQAAEAVDERLLAAFREQAHAAGLLPGQARALHDWYRELAGRTGAAQAAEQAKATDAAAAKLRADWGGAYEDRLAQARTALRRFGDVELVEMLESSGLGNEPRLLAAFARIGAALAEDGLAGAGETLRGSEAARAAIARIQGDPAHAYFHRDHPRHAAAVQEVYELFQQAWPEG